MVEKVQCPNCLGEAEKAGKNIICQTCDAIFEIKKTGSATVAEIGWKEKLENRVNALEAMLSSEPEPELEPEPQADEDDILPP